MKGEEIHPKINFLCIGVPRSGTAWIRECLSNHPQIAIPKGEIHFFNKEKNYKKGLKWYLNLFKSYSNNSIKGEITPDYLFSFKAVSLIKNIFPNIKLIICLRNPIERAYSHFTFDKATGKIPPITFETALEIPLLKQRYAKKGFYYLYLQRWLEIFDKKQILILFHEDIEKNPRQFIQTIYKFLRADANFVPNVLNKKINQTGARRPLIPFINSYQLHRATKTIKKFHLGKQLINVIKFLKLNILISFLIEKNNTVIRKTNFKKPPIHLKTRKKLQAYFYNDIKNLEKITSKDLSLWK